VPKPPDLTSTAVAASVPAGNPWRTRTAQILLAATGLFLFILAIRMLTYGASGLMLILQGLSVGEFSGFLGFGWLMAYVSLSGSPVAAVSLTLLGGDTVTPLEAFAMINGSRLGASFIVLVTGFIFYLRGWRGRGVVSMGVLAMLTTATIYLPAMALGSAALQRGWLDRVRFDIPVQLSSITEIAFDPIVRSAADRLPTLAVFALGFAVLLLAFRFLDRTLPHVETRELEGRWARWLTSPTAMFVLGMLVTALTLSVSVSLSILVPLAARGMVRRQPVIPYIMGANITTFIDTLVASLLVPNPAAFTVVLTEMLTVALVSVTVLFFFYAPYRRMLLWLNKGITRGRWRFAGFVVLLAAVPLYLLLR
jgi:sodium-dependent phosphate cotransporter